MYINVYNLLNTDLANHSINTSNPYSVTKAQVGLGNCDNTADANKSVYYATVAGSINDGTVAFTPTQIRDRMKTAVQYMGLYEQEITLAGGATFFQAIPAGYRDAAWAYLINCSGNSLNFTANMEVYNMAVKNLSGSTLTTRVQVHCFGLTGIY